jgi:hypothetical protein
LVTQNRIGDNISLRPFDRFSGVAFTQMRKKRTAAKSFAPRTRIRACQKISGDLLKYFPQKIA